MKVTVEPVFRRFWYPVFPLHMLRAGPQRFELLGQALAVFLDARVTLEDKRIREGTDPDVT